MMVCDVVDIVLVNGEFMRYVFELIVLWVFKCFCVYFD